MAGAQPAGEDEDLADKMARINITAPNPPIIWPAKCSAKGNTMTIVWQPSQGNPVDHYTLEIGDGGQGPFKILADFKLKVYEGSKCSHNVETVSGLHFQRDYRSRVKAHNHAGESTYSEFVWLQTNGYYDDLASYIKDPGWLELLKPVLESDEFQKIINFLNKEYNDNKTIYPPKEKIFRAFEETPLNEVKVVIFGQDPCPNHNANGLAFSRDKLGYFESSLTKIFEELKNDEDLEYFFTTPNHGCLDEWAKQGVLLLNVALTIEGGQSEKTHLREGIWSYFTRSLIELLIEETEKKKDKLIFVLWGSSAKDQKDYINGDHFILEAVHPSPKNSIVKDDWPGCGHFSIVNDILKGWKKDPIDWRLPKNLITSCTT